MILLHMINIFWSNQSPVVAAISKNPVENLQMYIFFTISIYGIFQTGDWNFFYVQYYSAISSWQFVFDVFGPNTDKWEPKYSLTES